MVDTEDINIFAQRTAAHWIFTLFHTILCNPRDELENHITSAVSEKLTILSGTNNQTIFKFTNITFLLTMSTCPSCCHVIGCVDIYFNNQLNRYITKQLVS